MRSITMKKSACALLSGLLLFACTACGTQSGGPSAKSVPQGGDHPLIRSDQEGHVSESDWIPLSKAAESLGLHLEETDSAGLMGYTDVMFQVEPSQLSAVSFGKQVDLSHPPVRQNGKLHLTPRALEDLLQTNVRYDRTTGKLEIGSLANNSIDQAQEEEKQPSYNRMNILSMPANRNEMVSYARRYLGVRYVFGAAPYERSKAFDCSSFTQHVFKRFGMSLPRLARDQAKRGVKVSRSDLQVGDLIFFTVPGRFKTDRIPGHVGIYIGGGKFIHTWGRPGVQISPLDSGYWKDVVLSMRRVR